MNDLADSAVQAAEDEGLNTTVPNPRVGAWKMPEPVFRKTSGRLASTFVKKTEADSAAISDPEPSAVATSPTPGSSDEAPEPIPKSPVLKIVIVALAIAAMIAFIAVFLTVVYFMFLR